MANPSKRKGSGFELEAVRDLQECGIAAIKQPLSGALGGQFGGDLIIPVRGQDWRGECKRRRTVTLHKMKGSSRVLLIRGDREKTLVVLDLDDFAELAK